MRRKDRELTDPADLLSVLEKADVCHLAMSDHDVPYLVTMNFGLKHDQKLVLYFHCAHEGKKIDILKKNNRVCFGADIEHEFFMAEKGTSCGCSMRFRSVVGMGRISFITERTEKYEALKAILRHYTEAPAPVFDEKMVDRTAILRLDVEQISGKRRP